MCTRFALKRKGEFPNGSFCDRSSATTNKQPIRNRHELIPRPTGRGQDQSFQFLSVHCVRYNPAGLGQGKYDVWFHIWYLQMYVHTVQAMIAKLKLKCAHKKVDIFDRTLEEFFF